MRTNAPITIPATAPMLQYRRSVGDINRCLPAGISSPRSRGTSTLRSLPLVTTALAGGPPRSTDGASSGRVDDIAIAHTHDPLLYLTARNGARRGACLGDSARASECAKYVAIEATTTRASTVTSSDRKSTRLNSSHLVISY